MRSIAGHYLWFMVVALLFGGAATAQLNESDTLAFQLKTSLTGHYQSGNVKVLTLRSKLDGLLRFSNRWVFKSQNSSLYQEFFNTKADNDLFSRNYLYYQPQRVVYPYAIAYVSSNYRRKVDLRVFAGAGCTYQPLRKPHAVLKISANALYERSEFGSAVFNDDFYNGKRQIELWRATAFVSGFWNLGGQRWRLYYDAFWQPALNRWSNYRAQADIGLDFNLWKGLSFSVLFAYTHENLVPLRTQTSDAIFSFGLSYSQQRH